MRFRDETRSSEHCPTVAACSSPTTASSTAPPISPPPPAASTRCCARSTPGSAGVPPSTTTTNCSRAPADLGDAHERRHLDGAQCGRRDASPRSAGRPTRWPGSPPPPSRHCGRSQRRAPVIYQAAMFDGRFVGFADFLVLETARRAALPAARHQARPLGQGRGAAAAGRLRRDARRGGCAGRRRTSIWCSATAPPSAIRSTNCCRCTGRRRAALQRLLDDHLAGGRRCSGRTRRCAPASAVRNASEQVRDRDDLLLVAGMRVSQRARCIDAGITTVARARRARRLRRRAVGRGPSRR